jgi:hypothetical protein
MQTIYRRAFGFAKEAAASTALIAPSSVAAAIANDVWLLTSRIGTSWQGGGVIIVSPPDLDSTTPIKSYYPIFQMPQINSHHIIRYCFTDGSAERVTAL